jgi:hypothetical protein
MALRAEENALDAYETMVDRGVFPAQAQSDALRQFILLPDEKTVPDLANNPFET